jgi:hypothetical protein
MYSYRLARLWSIRPSSRESQDSPGEAGAPGVLNGTGTGGKVMGGSGRYLAVLAAALLSAGMAWAVSGERAGEHVRSEDGKVWIDNVPVAAGDRTGNGYIRGLEILLAHAGTPVAYERLMGLSGMAFIAQADVEHRWEGKVDVGWWPLDAWGMLLRREFLASAIGYELRQINSLTLTAEEFLSVRDRLPEVYRERVEPHVKASIDAGRPLLAMTDFGFVVAGYDDATDVPPVLGRCGRETETEYYRPERWPIGLLVLGDRTDALDPDAADLAALRYAVDLAYDRAGPKDEPWRDQRFTGQKAFAAWAGLLRNMDEPVEDRHHYNMKLHLGVNRTAGVAYLQEVAGRCEGQAAEALHEAVAAYESVLELLAQMECDGLATDPDVRLRLADDVDRLAGLELDAAQHIEGAVEHMSAEGETMEGAGQGKEAAGSMTGRCHCGRVAYRAAGPVVKQSYCDCRGCRKATGTLRAPFVTVSRAGFEVSAGEPSRFRAESGDMCDGHGQWAFCPHCGTQLFWDGDGSDQVDVFAGTLDDTSLFAVAEE